MIAPELVKTWRTANGTEINVRLFNEGEPYFGRHHQWGKIGPCLASELTVEFYDARYIDKPSAHGHPLGQFTGGRYWVSTVLGIGAYSKGHARGQGLLLNADIPAWTIGGPVADEIRAWFAEHVTPRSRPLAGYLANHRVTVNGTVGLLNEERYGPKEEFVPYDGASGGFYSVHGVAHCGHAYVSNSHLPGYVFDPREGETFTICYQCDATEQIKALAELRSGMHYQGAQVSDDGKRLVTHYGAELAAVTLHRSNSMHHTWEFTKGDRVYTGHNSGEGYSITVSLRERPAT